MRWAECSQHRLSLQARPGFVFWPGSLVQLAVCAPMLFVGLAAQVVLSGCKRAGQLGYRGALRRLRPVEQVNIQRDGAERAFHTKRWGAAAREDILLGSRRKLLLPLLGAALVLASL